MSIPAVTALLAEHYAVRAATLEEISDNVLRVVTDNDDELAVKLFAPADVDRAGREAMLLAHLADPVAAYRIQTLLSTARGELVASLPTGAALVTRWCRGAKKVYTTITTAEWRALGAEVAALHVRLDTFTGPLPSASDLVLDLAAERAAMEAARARAAAKDPTRAVVIGRYLDARLELLDARGERGLRAPVTAQRAIHNDYNQHNYLFDGVLPPIILDWEGAIAAPREYEVVRCLNHLPLVAPDHAHAFVTGYTSVRPLSPDGLAWAVDRALLEHAVKSWPLERWLGGLPDAERLLAGSMEVLHALHDGVGELARFFGVETAP